MKIVNITPDLARLWLKKNVKNRAISNKHVETLANELVHGNWKLNGETIKFNLRGELLDGQHRLHACILSGVAFNSYIITDIDNDAFDTIDVGSKRTSGAILGMYGVKNYNNVSAIAKAYYDYKTIGNFSYPSFKSSPSDILNEYKTNEALYQKLGEDSLQANKFVKTGFFAICKAAIEIYGNRYDIYPNGWYEDMLKKLKTGENLYYGDPILTLREWTIRNVRAKRQERAAYVKVIKAICTGKELKVLRFTDDDKFPML